MSDPKKANHWSPLSGGWASFRLLGPHWKKALIMGEEEIGFELGFGRTIYLVVGGGVRRHRESYAGLAGWLVAQGRVPIILKPPLPDPICDHSLDQPSILTSFLGPYTPSPTRHSRNCLDITLSQRRKKSNKSMKPYIAPKTIVLMITLSPRILRQNNKICHDLRLDGLSVFCCKSVICPQPTHDSLNRPTHPLPRPP